MLSAIYAYMYMLLQMEDYVLLSGTVGLFVAFGLVMYATRNVDWFSIGQRIDNAVRPEPHGDATQMAEEGIGPLRHRDSRRIRPTCAESAPGLPHS